MTIQEMYQELKEQQLEELVAGYTDLDFYDDCYSLPEVDYTTQEWKCLSFWLPGTVTLQDTGRRNYHTFLELMLNNSGMF